MSDDFVSVPEWLINNVDITDGQDSGDSETWEDGSTLKGSQFFAKYTSAGSPTVTLTIDVSPVAFTDQVKDPADFYETHTVSAAVTAAGKWYDPPTVMDRPIGQYRVKLATSGADITAAYVAITRNGVG